MDLFRGGKQLTDLFSFDNSNKQLKPEDNEDEAPWYVSNGIFDATIGCCFSFCSIYAIFFGTNTIDNPMRTNE